MSIHVAACSAARLKALVDGDFDGLSTLLAEELRYVHATGVCHDRAGYLDFVRERMTFLGVSLESPVIKEYGAVAVVTGVLRQRVLRAGETEPIELSSFAIEVWKHVNGWRLIDFQSTKLPHMQPLNQTKTREPT